MRTRNFTVITDAGKSVGESIARRLEGLLALLEDAFPRDAARHRNPVVVIAASDEAAMARSLPSLWEDPDSRKPDGIFRAGLDKDYIVARLDAPSESRYSTLYHEAFHVFSRHHFGPLPLWLDEGLAKFWETTAFESDRVRIGVVSRRNLKILADEAWIPLPVLLAADPESPHYRDTEGSALFYAQSWALVHYLLLGDDTGVRRRELIDLLHDPAKGSNVFGDLDTLSQSVQAYAHQRRFKLVERPRPDDHEDTELRARVLSEAEALAVHGDFLAHGDTPERARAGLERARELDPNLALVHEALGFVALDSGDTQAALDAFARAGALDSSSFLVHYYYAVASLRAGEPIATALARVERSIDMNPDFAPAHLLVATALAELGDDDGRGLDSAHALVRLTPHDPEAHQLLGRLLIARGDETTGVDSLRTALELTPSESRIYRELAVEFLELDLFDEASLALERASALDPEDPEVAFTLALTLSEAGRLDDAVRAFETATALAPNVGRYHYRYGELLMEHDRNAEAVPILERSLELDPDAIAARRDLGRALLATGRPEAAIPYLHAAVEQSPRLASLHYELATAFAAVGNAEEAEQHFRLAEELER